MAGGIVVRRRVVLVAHTAKASLLVVRIADGRVIGMSREREGGCACSHDEPSPPKARLDCAGRFTCFTALLARAPYSGEPASVGAAPWAAPLAALVAGQRTDVKTLRSGFTCSIVFVEALACRKRDQASYLRRKCPRT